MNSTGDTGAPAPADLVLRGGPVVTLDADGTVAAALAARGGRILFVGGEEEAAALIGPETRVVQLDGRAVIPGINDSHLHAAWLGAMWPRTVMGGGGLQGPEVGLSTDEDRREAILRAGRIAASFGITSYTEPGLGPGEDRGPTGCFGSAVFNAYAALADAGELTARVTVLSLYGELDGPTGMDSFERGLAQAPVYRGDQRWLRMAGVKIFADGIPPMRSAWTHHCYADGSHGDLLVEGADTATREKNLRRMVMLAHAAGHQIGVHATGDRSIEVVVDAVADAVADGRNDARHYVIHGDLVDPGTLVRMGALGMGINTQPGIAVATSAMLAGALGGEVAAGAWPLAGALAGDATLCLSSDAPILAPDWRQGIAAAAGWIDPGHIRDRRELMTSLLRCYTVNAAWQDQAEAWKGSLEAGKVADLCVLERNPLALDPVELPWVGIELTAVDGQVVYERGRAGV